MTSDLSDLQFANRRNEQRSSLFLGAALFCDGISTPARIRNLSEAGALVEATSVPDVGTIVQLVRGNLIVHALVVWSREGRCGLKFSGLVDVALWRRNPANLEQQRVDELVRLVKSGAVPLPVGLYGEHNNDVTTPRELNLSAELRRVIELLDSIGEALAEDKEILCRHAPALQKLDISSQLIAAVQSAIEIGPDPVTDGAKLAGLRRSANQALFE